MPSRRTFLRLGALGSLAAGPAHRLARAPQKAGPVVVSTWPHGLAANEAAWAVLARGGRALDAVEQGARISEADPAVQSVGYGGLPDRCGHVTLDACIMDERGQCGAVAFLEHVLHPVSVARRVMETTPHVLLAGEGALRFARAHGFEERNLLTPEAEAEWREWLATQPAAVQDEIDAEIGAEIDAENHDTIGLLALDAAGNLSGACTTSGAAWKRHGRIGDSPLIGAGLFVDNEVGGACASGWGEAVVRVAGSHLVVELMRQGHPPEAACRLAVDRVIAKNPDRAEIQVGFVALARDGTFGSYAIRHGFDVAVRDATGSHRLVPSKSRL